ncbi:hypothetical protein EYF80_035665 [Liparis tanakae]|uniref:Uncharacterized protein n=1 Tax=Liparis tanakae TaxID=230148 RepID=A0A4Z2GKV6_9TELE|nr:hypothetical protein EYF80_035665 [Liparis tanakae]
MKATKSCDYPIRGCSTCSGTGVGPQSTALSSAMEAQLETFSADLEAIVAASSTFHDNEVTPVSRVEEHQAVGRGGFKLKEEVHGGVRLQSGQRQVAAFRSKRHRVGDDVAHAEAGVQLAVGDVAVLALVEVGQPVEGQALEVADEVRGHHGYEAPLGHDARLDVVELQTRVGAGHLAYDDSFRSQMSRFSDKWNVAFFSRGRTSDKRGSATAFLALAVLSFARLAILSGSRRRSPSTVTLSTDSCRLLPRRTTFTVCHSLSFSFWPANSVSGPLPVVGGEGVGWGG